LHADCTQKGSGEDKMPCPQAGPMVTVELVILVAGPAPCAAGPATDRLNPEIDRVIAILDDPSLKGESKAAARRRALRGTTDGVFDWTEMAKRALGRHWAERTPAAQQEFVGLFRDLIERPDRRACIGKIERYSGEPISYAGEVVDGDQATVRTKILSRQGQEIIIDYRMLREGGDQWRVYDVPVEGISLVNNYRTQCDGIIKTGSYKELVKRLKALAS